METTSVGRPNVLRVDLGAISHNLAEVRRIAGSGVGIVAALKANAYGFGLERVAETVVAGGADMIALADITDALRLRAQGMETPVLLYAGSLADRSAAEAVAAHRLMPTILDRESAESYSTHAQHTVRVFIKIDVGLERLGVVPDQAAKLARQVRALPNLELHGVYTHVDVPDSPRAEEYVAWQIERYRATCMEIEDEGAVPVKMAASSAVLRCDPDATFDAVDPGHILFGLTPPGPLNVAAELRPALVSLTSRIIHAREIEREHFRDVAPFPLRKGMRFGVIPIGLRDGMAALNCGEVLVGGRRVSILGPLSLEHTRVDLSEVPESKVGDEVVIIGRQGATAIEPEEVASHQGIAVKAALALAAGSSIPREYG